MIVILGVFCFLYMIVLIVYAGGKVSHIRIWPLLGSSFLGIRCIDEYLLRSFPELKNVLLVLYVFLFVAGGCMLMLVCLLIYHGNRKIQKNAQYLIVLGAKINGTIISRVLKSRLDTAMLYLEENPDTKVIVSGGRGLGEALTEAEVMRSYLVEHGIAEERIIMEDCSVNTEQNIAYSKKILGDFNRKVVIVTNHFHIYRGLAIAKKQGFTQVSGMAAKTDRIMALHYYVREALAVVKYKCMGRI